MEINNQKYYHPTIEEFHVGFEFELLQWLNNSVSFETNPNYKEGIDFQWVNVIYDYPTDDFCNIRIFDSSKKVIEGVAECVRVKYLDREDIESLGWKLIDGHLYVYESKIENHYGSEGNIYLTQYEGHHPCLVSIDNNEHYEDLTTFFYGRIKNKSELKKLMQQLNINS